MSADADSPISPTEVELPPKWSARQKWNYIAWLAVLGAIGLVFYLNLRESDEAKIKRLQSDQTIACFEANNGGGADAAAKCALAQRELNKFMNGR